MDVPFSMSSVLFDFHFCKSVGNRVHGNSDAVIMIKSLVIHVDKLLVDHLHLGVGHTEGFSINDALDGGQLVQKDKIVVFQFQTDGVKSFGEDFFVKHVESSLFEAHVENSAKELEQVSDNIFGRNCVLHW